MNGNAVRVFFDTNILIYALAENTEKTARAFTLLEAGGVVSVQVLNEFINVLRRRFAMSWNEVERLAAATYSLCRPVQDLTEAVHHQAVQIARRYQYRIYDSNLIAAALTAKCQILYTEDLKHDQHIEGLTIRKPFTVPA